MSVDIRKQIEDESKGLINLLKNYFKKDMYISVNYTPSFKKQTEVKGVNDKIEYDDVSLNITVVL